MKPRLVREDTDQWQPLVGWIAQRPAMAMELPTVQTGSIGAANITQALFALQRVPTAAALPLAAM
jgi:hypothetical protein